MEHGCYLFVQGRVGEAATSRRLLPADGAAAPGGHLHQLPGHTGRGVPGADGAHVRARLRGGGHAGRERAGN